MATPINSSIEERLRDVSPVAAYDAAMQGAEFLLSMLSRREDDAASPAVEAYWRSRWRRVVKEKKDVPSDDPVAILVQRDIWVAEIHELEAAEQAASA